MIRNTALQLLTIAAGVTVGVLILTHPGLIHMHGTGLDVIAVAVALLTFDITDHFAARFEEDTEMDASTDVPTEPGR